MPRIIKIPAKGVDFIKRDPRGPQSPDYEVLLEEFLKEELRGGVGDYDSTVPVNIKSEGRLIPALFIGLKGPHGITHGRLWFFDQD